MQRWVDLSAHGLALKVRKRDDLRWLVLEALPGAGPVPEDGALALGFELRDGQFVRDGSKITLSEVQRVFALADVRDFEVDQLISHDAPDRPLVDQVPVASSSGFWWEGPIGEQYDAVYLIGASRGKETITLTMQDGAVAAKVSQAGVLRCREGTPEQILAWLRSDALVRWSDEFVGRKELSVDEVRSRLRLVKGPDVLFDPPGPAYEVMVPAPVFQVEQGNWERVLNATGLRGSVPINKVAWIKMDSDRWCDGKSFMSTAELAAHAERVSNVLEGQAVRVDPAEDAARIEADQEASPKPAELSVSRFVQRAQATHDGLLQWHIRLEGQPVSVPTAVSALSYRKRPETVLRAAHEALVRQHLASPEGLASAPFATLVDYPALVYPGAVARGRMAEINVMRLLGQLGIADALMEGESGYCILSNPPYMDLVVERHGFGEGANTLYLTHYFNQGGDRILDAEMVFKIEGGRLRLSETATISPRGGESRRFDRAFANMFTRNLVQQGFGEATVRWPNADAPRAGGQEEEPATALAPY